MNGPKIHCDSEFCSISEADKTGQMLLSDFHSKQPAALVNTATYSSCFIPAGVGGSHGKLLVSLCVTYTVWERGWAACEAIAQQRGDGATAQQVWDSSTSSEIESFLMKQERAEADRDRAAEESTETGGVLPSRLG